jgi:D-alanyl-D-alanine carboxypeptidase (penicillin-binding protein 5/6)
VTAVLLLFFLIVSCLGGEAQAARRRHSKKKAGPFQLSARSALLVDSKNLKVLYSKSSTRPVLPASTTKVMTAIVVLEKKKLDDVVTVSARAAAVVPSKIDIKAGERYTVRDLLYAALLKSANDASIALAEAVAGSEDKFVDMMNARARKAGAKHTLFANSHGLPSQDDPQYTTAHDMALLLREGLKKPFFREAIRKRFWTIYSKDGRKINLRSHNQALFKGWKRDIFGKTGYTRAARACFVGAVEKNGRQLIIAVFGCSSRWDDVKYIIEKHAGIDL